MAKKLSKKKSLAEGWHDHVNHGRVKDVTAVNYAGKAAAVAERNIPRGVMLCPIENPREWGAWLSYFKLIEKGVKYMHYIGHRRAWDSSAGKMWVPTGMPHMFDSDRLELTDTSAGDHFEAAQNEQRAKVEQMGTEEQRLKQAQAGVRLAKEGMMLPRDHNRRKERAPPPALPDRDPKRWNDKGELAASRDRIFKRLGMTLPEEEKDDAE